MKSCSKSLWIYFGHLVQDDESEIVDFAELDDPDLEHVITVHPNKEGMLIFSLFEPDQWSMIEGIAEVTGKQVSDIVADLEEENLIKKLVLDPKNYPEDDSDLF